MDVVPFREKTTFMGQEIYINIYKGEASISFEWDLPNEYSTENLIDLSKYPLQEGLSAMYYNNTPIKDSFLNIYTDIQIGTGEKFNNGIGTV
jgi:hypothetical protein